MSNTDKLVSKLKEIVGETHVIRDPDRLKVYALDGKRPKVIVFPKTIDEVSKVVAYANQEHLAITPMGNGTKMGMGNIPEKMDLVVSTSRLKRILDCDVDNLTLSVESGMTLGNVQKILAKEQKGYFLPLDPPFTDKATLGGIVATNSSGPKRFLFGTARDLVIGMKTVFPNGDIVVTGGKTVKNVSGYDLGKLLIGSFGTLGIICEITFKLLPLPEKEATLLIPFSSLNGANEFVHEIIHSQMIPAAVETFNSIAIKKLKYPISMPPKGNYLVVIGFGGVAESIERQISEMNDRGKKHGAIGTITLDSKRHQTFWIAVRDFSKGLAKSYPNLISLKSNILISKWGEVLGSYEKIAEGLGVDCALVCHSGNGILYSYLLTEENLKPKMDALVKLIKKLTAEAVKHEGNLVVESSPLPIKKRVDVWGKSRDDSWIMRRLKKQIDPAGIFNPGRFVGGI